MNTPKIRTVIVDDEALSRRGLEIRLLGDDGFRNRLAVLERPRGASPPSPDTGRIVVFLDIQMPGMSGFDVLTHLPQDCCRIVVFVTAYDQYAMRAFEARAVDYLLKPVDDARFATCLDRVRERMRAQHRGRTARPAVRISSRRSPAPASW